MSAIPKTGAARRNKALLLIAILLLLSVSILILLEGGANAHETAETRLESLRAQAAVELNDYYRGQGSWFRCYRLLQKIERLEQQ